MDGLSGSVSGPAKDGLATEFPRTALLTEIPAPYRVPFLNNLADRVGDRVRVFFYGETEKRRNWGLNGNLRIAHEVIPGFLFQSRHGHPYFFNPGIIGALRRFDPDVIVIGGYAHPTAPLVLSFARRWGKKIVLWSESTLLDERTFRWHREKYKRWFIERCDGFVVPGRAAREYVQSLGAVPEAIHEMPNAAELEAYINASMEAENHSLERDAILFVGRLIRSKGVWDLLEAYQGLDVRCRPPLWIVGDGPEQSGMEKWVRDNGVEGVLFLGPLAPEDLPQVYVRAGVFVLPSRAEPWGMVLNEAAASGLPLVASEGAGASREIIDHGRNGFTFPPGHVDSMRLFLSILISSPELRRSMGEEAREKIKQFEPEVMADRFIHGVLAVRGTSP